MNTATSDDRSVTVSRVIEAPPEQVYDAFLDPDDLAAWLPPTGFSAEVHHLEPEVGGTFRMTFTGETEEFAEYGHTFGGAYRELVPGERIVHTDAFETDDPAMAGEMTVTVTFKAVPDGTEATVRQDGIPEAIPPSDANDGWNDSLGNLAEIVERRTSTIGTTDTSLTIRRTVDAPRECVWNAITDPEEIGRWYGADLMDVQIHTFQAEPEGTFSVTMDDGENQYGIEGTIVEVVENERLVHTWYVGQVTIELHNVGDGTEVVLTHEDLSDRETVEQHETGWAAALETLATTLEGGTN